MRVLMVVGCVLVAGAGVGRAASPDEVSVREHSGRYTTAILKKDLAGLFGLLHTDYLGRHLPGAISGPDLRQRQTVAHWTDRDLNFSHFDAKVENVRLFGDTAIETGTFTGASREHGSNATYGGLRYTRVWVRDGQGWRLAHEHY
jgi:ketosteroid isomerase-like protein